MTAIENVIRDVRVSWSRAMLVFCCVATAEAQQPELPPVPGRLVDVGGRRMHLLCTGNGAPTVVLEAGASSFAIDWTLVQGDLARATRVCSYDRAGMGWSDPSTAGTRASTAPDLHTLLTVAGERPPYVMVGASRGGLFIRAYVADYPTEVVGLVFVDPTTEDRLFTVIDGRDVRIADVTAEELRATNPKESVAVRRRRPQTGAPFDRLPPDLYRVRVALDEKLIASFPDSVTPDVVAAVRESERGQLARLDSLRKTSEHPLGELPVVVLSRGANTNADRTAAHAALGRLSTSSYHCVVAGAGHEIHLLKPSAVVHAVTDIVDVIRNSAPLRRREC